MSEDSAVPGPDAPESRKRWAILAVLYLCMLAFGVTMQSVPPILNLVISEFGLLHSQAGLLMSFFALPGIVISIPVGILADRYNPKVIIIVSLLLMMGGAAIFASAGSFPVMLLGRTVSGIGAITMAIVLSQLVTHWFLGRELGIAMGIFNTGVPLGTVLSMNLLSLLAQNLDWRTSIWFSAGLALVALVFFTWFYVPAPRKNEHPPPPSESFFQSIRQGGGKIWLVGGAWMFFNATMLLFFTFTPDLLTVAGFSIASAGFLTGVVMWPALALSPAIGLFIDKVGHKRTIIAFGGIALAVVMFQVPGAVGGVLPLMLLVGVAQTLVPVPTFSLPADIISPERLGYAFGIISVTQSLGIVAGPAAAGWLRDLTGSYQASYTLASGFAILITVMMLFLKTRPASRRI